jgi:hypothetical protein
LTSINDWKKNKEQRSHNLHIQLVTKENNMDINQDKTNIVKDGREPLPLVSSTTPPLLIKLEHLNIALRGLHS